MSNNIFEKIFCVKNKYINNKKYKVINFLFISVKFSVKNYKLDNHLNEIVPKLQKDIKIMGITPSLTLLPKKVFIAVCAIYKNEPDIIEWIEYHRLIGVEKFYLYDNGSTDNSIDLLKKYIDNGVVIYHYLPGEYMQLDAYKDAIYRYKNDCKWMAIIDLDEYICPIKKDNLKDFLKDYEKYPAVGINWVMFDSNGLVERPNKLVIEAYTRVMKDYQNELNLHIKSIVKPDKVQYIYNPHFCTYNENQLAVDENFNLIGKPNDITACNAFTTCNSVNKIRINHYHTKSLMDYERKVKIGRSDCSTKRPPASECVNFSCETDYDYVIQKYLTKLKENLKAENINT